MVEWIFLEIAIKIKRCVNLIDGWKGIENNWICLLFKKVRIEEDMRAGRVMGYGMLLIIDFQNNVLELFISKK